MGSGRDAAQDLTPPRRFESVRGLDARIRRTLTATTAGALALLRVAGAYVARAAMYHDDLGYPSDVPFLYLGLAVVGVPPGRRRAGWLFAGREPPAIARAIIK
jgi:putative ABC transport system permease protein